MESLLIAAISCYQKWWSARYPSGCRFEPSCSQYAKIAIEKYGALKGIGKALKRLVRCGPWIREGTVDLP